MPCSHYCCWLNYLLSDCSLSCGSFLAIPKSLPQTLKQWEVDGRINRMLTFLHLTAMGSAFSSLVCSVAPLSYNRNGIRCTHAPLPLSRHSFGLLSNLIFFPIFAIFAIFSYIYSKVKDQVLGNIFFLSTYQRVNITPFLLLLQILIQLIGASWKPVLTEEALRRHLGRKISLSVLSCSPKSSCGQNNSFN